MDIKIGILGGGQLAMMMTQAAIKIGFHDIYVLDPTPECPASKVGAKQIVGSFKDKDTVVEFAKQVDVLTYDIESVSIEGLKEAEKITKVYPNPSILETIQDKWTQKKFVEIWKIPVPEYYEVADLPDHWKKFVLKTKRGGYDGKGVWVFEEREQMELLLAESGMEPTDFYVEKYIPFERELAVICYRSEDQRVPYTYPIVETTQEDGICFETICPTPLDQSTRDEIERIAKLTVTAFNTYGVFAFELFLTKDNKVYLNEISPRVHNSGHYTIEATNCSQFEQHIRCITSFPTIKPYLTMSPVRMTNSLGTGMGDDVLDETSHYYGNYHYYHKKPKNEIMFQKNRKIGHYTEQIKLGGIPYPIVYIVMGSSSDLPTLQPAIDLLNEYRIPIDVDVVSAHRSPRWMYCVGLNAESWCVKVVIAAAGGAAHLPGMLASLTSVPVIGVPVPSKHLRGEDSLLSIVEMPDGVPVATVGIGKAKNAAILALKILGVQFREANEAVIDIMNKNQQKVIDQREDLLERFE